MRVVLGSQNPPKLRAVEMAFSNIFSEDIHVEPSAAKSGVADHPTTADESLEGAINRADHAQVLCPGADYYVGIEGGFMRVGNRTWEIGWVAIQNAAGELHTAPSAGVEIGGKLLEAILGGQDLAAAIYDQYGLKDIGKGESYYGLATDGHVDRTDAYTDAVTFALAPFKHPEFYQ